VKKEKRNSRAVGVNQRSAVLLTLGLAGQEFSGFSPDVPFHLAVRF
jgi:hypothetical protein